ncbi:MAG: diguanylate cyclase [Candidatus Riflebacteria bacterium]|nr:diguanylate cyclase [Candidatus Riflebacteria bacterium]
MTEAGQPPDSSLQQQVLRYEYVLGALSDIGDELCRVTSFDAQLKSLLHLLLGTLGVSKGGIFLFSAPDGNLTLRCAWKLVKKQLSIPLTREEVEILEKPSDQITYSIVDFPFLPTLKKAISEEDLNCISVLKVREKFIGLLVVGHKLKKDSFTDKEVSFLTTLSRNISVAINNYLLLSDLREANRQLDDKIREVSILYQATQMIASELQLQSLLDMAMDLTSEISEMTRGSIWLFDEDHQTFSRKSQLGENTLPELVELVNSPIFNHLLQNKEPFILRDGEQNPVAGPQDIVMFGSAFIMVPIIHSGEFLGVMHLSEKSNTTPFTSRDERLVKVFAVQLGAAVKNAKLYEQAITDGMTHLYLHRYFKQRLFDEVKRAARFDRHLAIVMIDIDHFKRFNDTYGHQMGDEVLKKVASLMRKAIRTHDLPVRYGGEEFALVLPETDMPGAVAVAERVRRSIEIEDLEFQGKTIKISASLGVAVFPESAREMDTLIKAADVALYASKENGRNQVTAAPAVHPPPSAPTEPIPER